MVRVPVAAVGSIGFAILAHLLATVQGLLHPYWIGPFDWAALAASETMLLVVVLARPESFRLRNFRLPGVLVVSMTIIIWAPLPGVIRQYGSQVPRASVLAIAAGVAATAFVLAVPDCVRRPRVTVVPRRPQRTFVLVLGLAALVMFPIWIMSLPNIPVLDLLSGRSTGIDIARSRDEALMGLATVPLRLAIGVLRNLYLPFAVAWLVSDWCLTPRAQWMQRRRHRHAAAAVAAVAALYAVVTTERSSLGQVVLVGFVASLVALRRPLSSRLIAISGPLVLAFPLLFGVLNTSGGGLHRIGGSIESVRRRVFYLPADVMVHYFTAFPERHGYLAGSSVPKLSRLTGHQTFDLSQYIYNSYYRVDANLDGIANGSYMGVGWANFGFIGVVLWSVFAAASVVLVERALRRLPIRTSAALRAVAVVQVGFLTSVDVFRSLLGFAPGFLDLLAISWLFAAFYRRRTYGISAQPDRQLPDRAAGAPPQRPSTLPTR
jgi:hypothetical protein